VSHLLTTNGFVVQFWPKSESQKAWPKTNLPSMMLPSFGNANTAVCRPRQVRVAVARGRKRARSIHNSSSNVLHSNGEASS